MTFRFAIPVVTSLFVFTACSGERSAKSKSAEARKYLKKMYDGAWRFNSMSGDMVPAGPGQGSLAQQFPGTSVGPTPPLGTCCNNGGKCDVDSGAWQKQTWMALMFSVDDPHYYSYEYKVKQDETSSEFTVLAYGDLDCDGVHSTFKMSGTVTPGGGGPAGSPEMQSSNELE